MQDIINYCKTNWVEIVAAVTGIMWAARAIVKITPTPKDDALYAKLIALLKHIGLVIPDQPKK
jgi:hypothetical protein